MAVESYHLLGRQTDKQRDTTKIICFTGGQKIAAPKICGPMRPHSPHRLKAVTELTLKQFSRLPEKT